ncbi:hypothetical protein MJT46_017313 [Ovis ammon polii x Ovis aries]|nr:hypothetical protein MJT46_017313 [Ovis ammon polii x Ovis aries]
MIALPHRTLRASVPGKAHRCVKLQEKAPCLAANQIADIFSHQRIHYNVDRHSLSAEVPPTFHRFPSFHLTKQITPFIVQPLDLQRPLCHLNWFMPTTNDLDRESCHVEAKREYSETKTDQEKKG